MTGELQLMTPQENLESVANHSLRALNGEKPEGDDKKLRQQQANIAKKTPNNKAQNIANALQSMQQQQGTQPLNPAVDAQTLQSMQ
jgi:hypothetical protein